MGHNEGLNTLTGELAKKEYCPWGDIESAPYNEPILCIIVMQSSEEQLKGINQGWLRLPNALPFIGERIPEDDEYPECWRTLDAYGKETDEDHAAPTHWMPLPQPPKLKG